MDFDRVIFGHSTSDRSQSDWEPLATHLDRVACGNGIGVPGAENFAAAFGAAPWGRVAGLWHDIGKFSKAFQDYIRKPAGDLQKGPDHSTAGALLAAESLNRAQTKPYGEGLMLAYAIAGHHTGLPDWSDNAGGQSGLVDRLKKTAPEIRDALGRLPRGLRDQPHPGIPGPLASLKKEDSDFDLRVAFFVRMLFSCLVDADFLATEAFLDPSRAGLRAAEPFEVDLMLAALNSELNSLSTRNLEPRVAHQRAELLRACRERAALAPGLFSLTAPTGSGKTLGSLAFALEHARRHGLRRIIYALPFTSVTEQTAGVFRRVFAGLGDGVVLEHHIAASWRGEDEQEIKTARARLAAENWDAPIVVTTNVQILESLFASRTSACRKLHRIARSVIIFDEAQALPVHLLRPTLSALDELARGYGASIVLCSATMPALTHRDDFKIGLRNVREIVPDPKTMADEMRRVRVERAGAWSDDDLAGAIAARPRVLAIVNNKRHAASAFRAVRERVGTTGVFHLSAAMCPQHRSDTINRIRLALKSNSPCRVVSTQVIEAGVDIDFPVVLRAAAGLDSIAQAAGRCNREGRLDAGEVIVFDTEWKPAPMVARQADTAREIAGLHPDPLSLDAVEHYFRLHYWSQQANWDKHAITDMFDCRGYVFQFREAAAAYRVIEEQTTPIIVPFGDEGRSLVDELLASPALDRALLRKAQRYTVGVHAHQLAALEQAAACERVHDAIHVLIEPDAYDADLGLAPGATTDAAERLASW